jgi:hypothetical protein
MRKSGDAQRTTQPKRAVSENVGRIPAVGAVDVEVKKEIGCYPLDDM